MKHLSLLFPFFLAPSLSAQSLLGSFSSLGPAQAESSELLSASAFQPFAVAEEEANLIYGFAEQMRVVQEAAVLEALALDRSEATLTEGESVSRCSSFALCVAWICSTSRCAEAVSPL